MHRKYYLIHWNIQGSTRNKKDSIKKIIDKANKRKLSIIYCLNELNNHYINQKHPNIYVQGFDKNASGGG